MPFIASNPPSFYSPSNSTELFTPDDDETYTETSIEPSAPIAKKSYKAGYFEVRLLTLGSLAGALVAGSLTTTYWPMVSRHLLREVTLTNSFAITLFTSFACATFAKYVGRQIDSLSPAAKANKVFHFIVDLLIAAAVGAKYAEATKNQTFLSTEFLSDTRLKVALFILSFISPTGLFEGVLGNSGFIWTLRNVSYFTSWTDYIPILGTQLGLLPAVAALTISKYTFSPIGNFLDGCVKLNFGSNDWTSRSSLCWSVAIVSAYLTKAALNNPLHI